MLPGMRLRSLPALAGIRLCASPYFVGSTRYDVIGLFGTPPAADKIDEVDEVDEVDQGEADEVDEVDKGMGCYYVKG